jgi:Swi5-dependent recombination DNA repair protein 1
MGGPRAWKEMQKKQQEFQNSWGQEEQSNHDSDRERNYTEKRDLYAEYDIEPETENEKSQRTKGVGNPEEPAEEEDVYHPRLGLTLSQIPTLL